MADIDTFDPDVDEREERRNQLDTFARAGEGGAREVVIPQQMFAPSGERVIGAQEVAVHRDESRVLAKLKMLSAAAGEDWYYRFPVKNKRENRVDWIEGPSIKLTNDLARLYGNCDVDIRVVDQGDSWLFYARFTDFETGFSLTRPFQQRKNASRMGGDESRRLDIAFQIGVSKAERNVVANALQTFADFAFEEAKQAIIGKVGKNIDAYRAKILERLAGLKIDKSRVERSVGRTAEEWLAQDIARIIAMMKAIADGMATWDETFPAEEAPAGNTKSSTAPKSLDQFAGEEKRDPEGEDKPEPKAGEKAAAKEPVKEEARADASPAPKQDAAKAAEKPAAGDAGKKADAPATDVSAQAAGGTAADPSDPAAWTDDQCREHGRKAFARGMTRKAVVPPPLRVEGMEGKAALVLAGFDAAAAEKGRA